MNHPKQFTGGLLALCVSIGLQTNALAATDAPTDFRIMNPAEVTAHSAAMGSLQGTAREDYRNAQYQQLKKRALERGFKLPADPPWAGKTTAAGPAGTAGLPPVPAPGAETPAETAARHAAMREKLEARREAMQQASEANLEHLQQAASAQQQQVEAQLQASREGGIPQPGEGATLSEAGTDQPSPATPAVTPVSEPAVAAEAAAIEAPNPADTGSPATATAAQTPAPPAAPVAASDSGSEPRFAPVEIVEITTVTVPEPPMAPVPPPAPARPTPMPAPPADSGKEVSAGTAIGSDGQPYATSDAMAAYRESMRSRFDEYMQERQAQLEENARRQREKHEAAMEQSRSMQPNWGRFQPPPYPAMPAYGPRYPTAYPDYRTPYWQQR